MRGLDEVKLLRLLLCTCLPRCGERRCPLATWAPYAIALSPPPPSLPPPLAAFNRSEMAPIRSNFVLAAEFQSRGRERKTRRAPKWSGAKERERERALREENSHEPPAGRFRVGVGFSRLQFQIDFVRS